MDNQKRIDWGLAIGLLTSMLLLIIIMIDPPIMWKGIVAVWGFFAFIIGSFILGGVAITVIDSVRRIAQSKKNAK
ncbi:hypothetical protein [Paenibacillus xylanexedens]|uniref:hypothetical protein n=1 Tax=Paenibacillus xylanexedens TaxID=528191 RepID=UPI000F5297B2|nr:hypothetical protein [Paenibacillus xylanexedens]RPK20104.1 hypothetical protein EDO6_06643 [Paenibacillus xylanexedens]